MISGDPRLPQLTPEESQGGVLVGFLRRFQERFYQLWRELAKELVKRPEESRGTWTPADGSGAGLSFTAVTAEYVKHGSLVFVSATLTFPATASGAAAIISGLPYAIAAGQNPTGATITAMANVASAFGIPSSSTVRLYQANGGAAITNANMTGSPLYFSLVYEV